MASLIIGHTTETTARIWVRGDSAHRSCRIVLESEEAGESPYQDVPLSAEERIGVAEFSKLAAGTTYGVTATFSPHPDQRVQGRLRTLSNPGGDGKPLEFSFVLSSCNLSIVSINNLLAYLLAAGGTSAGMNSLDLPTDRWMHPKLAWLWSILKYLIKGALFCVAWVLTRTTGLKQPDPPLLRSPFLRLSAVFDSWLLEYRGDPANRPSVGDTVNSGSGQGVVACSPKDLSTDKEKSASKEHPLRVVVTHVVGKFQKDEELLKQPLIGSGGKSSAIGKVTEAYEQDPWYRAPSFFLHVGDQIYYDFPNEIKEPDRDAYRIAYREAWFNDDANRHLLSHWPHYMILDDHEIADQYARDFNPPSKSDPQKYLDEAMVAYDEYVGKRNPERGHVWYTFEKGDACFFVLDTRTERYVHRGQMIGQAQMAALLQWMVDNRKKLKFVITSVPFVAEINVGQASESPKWYSEKKSGDDSPGAKEPLNPEDDKWTAFKEQREAIIDHIGRHDVENLVFLTGDMHCCYHASMRIGASKYQSTTIHELAGGPVNQLQLADVADFHTIVTNTTAAGTLYEGVLDRFHGALSAVIHVEVTYAKRSRALQSDGEYVPELTWNVIRTLTDNGPSDWVADPDDRQRCADERRSKRKHPLPPSKKSLTGDRERAMTGTISFQKKRETKNLRRW